MDKRTREQLTPKFYKKVDEQKMLLTLTLYGEEKNKEGFIVSYEEDVEVPFHFDVCALCKGRGKHVNPSVDGNGLTHEDFDEDPDFRDEYLRGRYDVSCSRCNGTRVQPEISFSELRKLKGAAFVKQVRAALLQHSRCDNTVSSLSCLDVY